MTFLPSRRSHRSLVCLMFVVAALAVTAVGEARNPLTQYFSQLLDESKAEIAIGLLMRQELESSITPSASMTVDPVLARLAKEFAPKSPRPGLAYEILVLESTVPGEIPLPGGPIILTTGLLELAGRDEQKSFLVARNMMHVALRHPIMLLKQEGMYAAFLKHLKVPPSRRDTRQIRSLLRDYLRAVGKLNHLEADRRALEVMPGAREVRAVMIPLLRRLEEMVWPLPPWEWGDLPTRIQALEAEKGP